MSETAILKHIQVAISRAGARVFRNNVALAWAGSSVTKVGQDFGDVLIKNARPIHAGLCEGSSDLIGFTPIEVTPDMVGKRLAIFTAIEVKAPRGHVEDIQRNFIDTVRAAGGIAMIARSEDEAIKLLNEATWTIQNRSISNASPANS